jgi:multisubunit Na+/H+ antiporter MnhB subunit
MVDYCLGYVDKINCIVELNNVFTIKSLSILFLLISALVLLYFSYKNDWGQSYFDYFLNMMFRFYGYITLVFFLFFLWLLRPSFDFEQFVIFVISFYTLCLGLVIVLCLMFGFKWLNNLFHMDQKLFNKLRFKK